MRRTNIKSNVSVICHSRKKFYNGKDIYWYEFLVNGVTIHVFTIFIDKFLRIPDTQYYEFGGNHDDAIKALTIHGITDIVNGKEI